MLNRRRLGIGLALLLALVVAGGLWLWQRSVPPEAPPPDRLALSPAGFADLPGWRQDRLAEAVPALLRSCGVLLRLPADRAMGLAGTAGDWRQPCNAAAGLPPGDETAARAFFEREFQPFAASNNGDAQGLFTGYYEPSLRGSRQPGEGFAVPLLARPPDLVSVDLGLFREQLKGQRIAGRVVEGALRPFESRAEIEAGALAGRGLELVWVDDPVDAFFLHIQGSGRVELNDGGLMRVGYAAQNGHPYVAIGRHLLAIGAIAPGQVSMQSIRAWLAANPERAGEVMALNPSYIFFREIDGEGPLGAQGVPLTPGRSMAVDRQHLPLGVPLWLDGSHPSPGGDQPDRPLRRLFVAQDTGGAIRGPVRGDVFWGHEPDGAAIAGRMQHAGRWWLLLPRAVAERHLAAG